MQHKIEQKTTEAYMDNVIKFQNKVLDNIPPIANDNKEKSKELSSDVRDKLVRTVE